MGRRGGSVGSLPKRRQYGAANLGTPASRSRQAGDPGDLDLPDAEQEVADAVVGAARADRLADSFPTAAPSVCSAAAGRRVRL
jgi:hypothetical protein